MPYIFTNAFASIVSNAIQRDPVAFFKRSETELVSLDPLLSPGSVASASLHMF